MIILIIIFLLDLDLTLPAILFLFLVFILLLFQDFVKNLVTDGLGVELNNKVNEMNLILANHISDKVIDDVIDNLSR